MTMSGDSFRELLRRVRAGDQDAAAELVRRYEPSVRGAARVPLQEMRLRHILDSTDISQAVLANFFRRAADGQFELTEPDQLLKLLITMARNKVLDEARRIQTQRRGGGAMRPGADHCLDGLEGDEPTPSRIVASRDLAETVFALLTPEEREIIEQRALGRSWHELAGERGSEASALRKRITRSLQRVAGVIDPQRLLSS